MENREIDAAVGQYIWPKYEVRKDLSSIDYTCLVDAEMDKWGRLPHFSTVPNDCTILEKWLMDNENVLGFSVMWDKDDWNWAINMKGVEKSFGSYSHGNHNLKTRELTMCDMVIEMIKQEEKNNEDV